MQSDYEEQDAARFSKLITSESPEATEDIEPGEILMTEDFGWGYICGTFLHRNKGVVQVTCHNCLEPTMLGLPCPKCRLVLFCSIECLREGTIHKGVGFHVHECQLGLPYLALVSHRFQYPFFIVLRMVFAYDFIELRQEVEEACPNMKKMVKCTVDNSMFIPLIYDFLQASEYDLKKMPKKTIFAILKGLLIHANGRAFEIDRLHDKVCKMPHSFSRMPRASPVGHAILPGMSCIKQSCLSNTILVPGPKRNMLLMAIKPIYKGETITVNRMEIDGANLYNSLLLDAEFASRAIPKDKLMMLLYCGDCGCKVCDGVWDFGRMELYKEFYLTTEDRSYWEETINRFAKVKGEDFDLVKIRGVALKNLREKDDENFDLWFEFNRSFFAHQLYRYRQMQIQYE